MRMKIGVLSLGCAKNRVDTEQMLALLKKAGHAFTETPAEADALIVNTCGFINTAKEESIDAILEMAEYKKTGNCRVLCVTGCLAQRYGDDLLRDMPEIDALLGVSRYADVAALLARAEGGERVDAREREGGFLECGRVLTTPSYSAYVRIGEGCDNRCAYCAIPLIRGSHRSRPMESVLAEMRSLAEGGAKEQILIAQDTTRYGRDTSGSLRELIREGAGIPGIEWLRVLYCYPDETDEALLDEMARHINVCRYLDLPLQHASSGILQRMNRRGDMDRIKGLLLRARAAGFALRTTFIVGFPGETADDFKRLMDFTGEARFDRMGAFAFSPEEDTPAAAYPDQVPEEVRKERLDGLMRLQAGISLSRNMQRIGQTAKVLVTGRRGALYAGRSAWEAPDADGEILFAGGQPLAEGEFTAVRITAARTYDLEGVALSPGEGMVP
jgi:ribosomal protein S12 methylthiotransferase